MSAIRPPRPADCHSTPGEHQAGLDCPVHCLATAIPGPAFRALAHALADRYPAKVPAVADLLALYHAGELARLPGLSPRSYAGVRNGLHAAGLITRHRRPAAAGRAAR